MKTRIILPLLFIALFFSCDKDKEPGIDYNVLTEQRILEISDQATISDEDIATLERLNANVTDNSLKAKYTEMIEGVKILKDFITAFDQLRSDPDVIFQDVYAELEEQLKQVTDQLPRKAKLQTDLETALANYNSEEVVFLEAILAPEGKDLARFLANNFDIHPVEGKPTSYLRSEIESVDSLVWNADVEGVVAGILKSFRGLKYFRITNEAEKVIDLNHLRNLETLSVNITNTAPVGWELKFDQLQDLKHLLVQNGAIAGGARSPFGEVIDFTDKYPLLETLELPALVTNNLTTFLLPDKQHLKKITFPYGANFYKIKRLVVEGNGTEFQGNGITLGKIGTPLEVDEIRLSGVGTGVGGTGIPGQVKIKKLSLSDVNGYCDIGSLDIEKLELGDLTEVTTFQLNEANFSEKPDFSTVKLSKATDIYLINSTYANGTKFSWADISPMFTGKPTPETLKQIFIVGLTGTPPTQEYMKGLFPNLESYEYYDEY